jgi:hypothetical protein
MRLRKLFHPALLIAAAVMVTPACYTLLKHPPVNTVPTNQVAANDCTSCHYEDEVWNYHHPPNHPGYAAGRYNPNWAYFYMVPWWYDASWYYEHAATGPATVPLNERGMRPAAGAEMGGAAGGGISSSPVPKSGTGAPLGVKDPTDTRKGDTDDKKSKDSSKRKVRPGRKKKKDDGKK